MPDRPGVRDGTDTASLPQPRILELWRERVEWREVEGEIVALNLESSTYLTVNSTGRVLWADLARGATRDELVEALIKAYGIERERAKADVDAFLDMLREQGLLRQGGG